MGLGGNIGSLEWGLFAPEITHYLPLRSFSSLIQKYYIRHKCLPNSKQGLWQPKSCKYFHLSRSPHLSTIACPPNDLSLNFAFACQQLQCTNGGWFREPKKPFSELQTLCYHFFFFSKCSCIIYFNAEQPINYTLLLIFVFIGDMGKYVITSI